MTEQSVAFKAKFSDTFSELEKSLNSLRKANTNVAPKEKDLAREAVLNSVPVHRPFTELANKTIAEAGDLNEKEKAIILSKSNIADVYYAKGAFDSAQKIAMAVKVFGSLDPTLMETIVEDWLAVCERDRNVILEEAMVNTLAVMKDSKDVSDLAGVV